MDQPTPLSLNFFGAAVVIYSLSVVAFVLHLAFRRRFLEVTALGLVIIGWPLHSASVVFRALEGGHWPLGDMYEYSTGISLVVVTTALVLMLVKRMRLIGLPAMAIAVGLLGVGYMTYVPPGNLVPALHSYWLTIHVTAMASSSGILTFSFLFGMGYLARLWADERLDRSGGSARLGPGAATAGAVGRRGGAGLALAGGVQRLLPSAATLDAWSYRFVALGFPIWTFGVMCGAVWGEHAWGRYWGWDPKETFALVTWIVFAIYLHARVTMGWRGKRAAAITGVGFVAILFTLYAVNLWIAGLHSYARA
ncbi:MAG: c-type cytochrome biogenesis protein CcsB [Candidatus Dormibacteria bacterium]